jgi:hypothetical protein
MGMLKERSANQSLMSMAIEPTVQSSELTCAPGAGFTLTATEHHMGPEVIAKIQSSFAESSM